MKGLKGFTTLGKNIFVHETKAVGYTQMSFELPAQTCDNAVQEILRQASLWYFSQQKNTVQDNVPVPQEGKPVLTEDRYVYATFRALSEVFLQNRGLDFSKPGVLKEAVGLLQGRTVYPNHQFQDIFNWLGVVSNAYWDAKGEKSNGVPGINCEIKIDAFLNYRIACGLMMNPPAVNAMSLTVLFEFEYSHPHMERWKFWEMLGEEVDGEVVRIIVTKIKKFWEASLVPIGEDELAVHHGDEMDENEEESFSAANGNLPTNSIEVKTMKIDKAKQTELGIEFDGEDVPESELMKAAETLAAKVKEFNGVNLADLKAKAGQTDTLMTAKRAEVTRLARLAELGAEQGDLPEVVTLIIEEADADKLVKLEALYRQKAAEKFPNLSRSSLEGSEEIENAGGVKTETKPVKLPKVKR